MIFVSRAPVRFAHVDAAGIVFYPRYFEMVNAAQEDFFAEMIGIDFCTLHIGHGLGVPTVKLESEFFAPSRLGDMLDIALTVTRCGQSSAGLAFHITCNGNRRLNVQSTIVCMDLKAARSTPWPQRIRDRLEPLATQAAIAAPVESAA